MTTIDEAVEQVGRSPERLHVLFPSAARQAAKEGRDPDAARQALLLALTGDGDDVASEIETLYRHGDSAEKRAVLLALPALDDAARLHPVGDRALPIVRDALRTNDPRLVRAAMGPYAAVYLDVAAWRQAVLKFVFVGLPVDAVHGLADRADTELGRMAADYAAERRAAGRAVPDDIDVLLALAATAPPDSPTD